MAQQGSSAAETQRRSGDEAKTQSVKDFSTGPKPVNKARPAKSRMNCNTAVKAVPKPKALHMSQHGEEQASPYCVANGSAIDGHIVF